MSLVLFTFLFLFAKVGVSTGLNFFYRIRKYMISSFSSYLVPFIVWLQHIYHGTVESALTFVSHIFVVSSNNIVRRRRTIKVVVAVGNHQKNLANLSYLSLMPRLMLLVLPLFRREHLRLLMEMLKLIMTPM